MLAAQGIISKDDASKIAAGLDRVLAEIESGRVHVLARARRRAHERRKPAQGADRRAGRAAAHGALAQRPGGDRLPALRARLDRRRRRRAGRRCSWRSRARRRRTPTSIMPGFTHLQPAQPVTFGHHLLAYVEMLARDRGRLADARARLNECPLGSAALAGTSFPDRPARDGRGARLRPADRQLARRRLRPRLRAGDAGRRRHRGHAPVALRRGDRDLDDAAVRLHRACPTSSPPAPRSCRRSATRTRPSWRAPRSGASPAPSRRC